MIIKGLLDEDYVNYKKASMFIIFPYCTFKCEKDCGIKCCQNSAVAKMPSLDVEPASLVKRYIENPITHSIVFGGLEPLDSWKDLVNLVKIFRDHTDDDIVIYTGYTEDEVPLQIQHLQKFTNIIVKFGRFVPDARHRFDDVLGVELASDNQYAKKIA